MKKQLIGILCIILAIYTVESIKKKVYCDNMDQMSDQEAEMCAEAYFEKALTKEGHDKEKLIYLLKRGKKPNLRKTLVNIG